MSDKKFKRAAISGITGMTGSWMAELLLDKGYVVYGLIRRSSSFNTERIDHLFNHKNLVLKYGDLSDYSSISNFIIESNPDLYFNYAAQSHVRVSFDIPEYTMDVVGTGTLRTLEAIKRLNPKIRFLNSSTSELFGGAEPPQNESTVMIPRSPYGVAKLAAHAATVNYREQGLFAVNAISFNHEGSRRGETFISRKISRAATRIKLGLQDKLVLGNLDSKRDFTDARDIVRGHLLILIADEPKDYVLATGESRSIKELLEAVFSELDLDWKDYVEFDEKYLRPTEIPELRGNATKIKNELGWEPQISFNQMISDMIESDMEIALREKALNFDMKE